MSKGNRTRTGRTGKLRRRAARAAKRRYEPGTHRHDDHGLASIGPVPHGLDLVGWNYLGPGNDFDELDDLDFARPDDALFDLSECPVADMCAGCGDITGLRPVIAAFTRPGGYDVACATLCRTCDGRSFLHLLGPVALESAFRRHAAHPQPGPGAVAEQDKPRTTTIVDAEGTCS